MKSKDECVGCNDAQVQKQLNRKVKGKKREGESARKKRETIKFK